jgi:hypothetical protein
MLQNPLSTELPRTSALPGSGARGGTEGGEPGGLLPVSLSIDPVSRTFNKNRYHEVAA